MAKPMFLALAVYLAVFLATALLSGEPEFLVPMAILGVLVFGFAALQAAGARRRTYADAIGDRDDPIPSAHLLTDDDTPLGDTPEAHDEISPHDLPLSHPGRNAAFDQAGGELGTTRGDADPSKSGRQAA